MLCPWFRVLVFRGSGVPGFRSSGVHGFQVDPQNPEPRNSGTSEPWNLKSLLADAEPLDQLCVAIAVFAFEVIEQPAPLTDQLQQSAPRMMILDVRLEVLGQVADAFAEQRDLDFR